MAIDFCRYALYAWLRRLGHASWKMEARSSRSISWHYEPQLENAQSWCRDRVTLARALNTSVWHLAYHILIRNLTWGLRVESSNGREAVDAAAVIRNKIDVTRTSTDVLSVVIFSFTRSSGWKINICFITTFHSLFLCCIQTFCSNQILPHRGFHYTLYHWINL